MRFVESGVKHHKPNHVIFFKSLWKLSIIISEINLELQPLSKIIFREKLVMILQNTNVCGQSDFPASACSLNLYHLDV
jgi:hypothetical protein